MASDGSQPVGWYGKAFPYLMHHEGMGKSESYASQRHGHGAAQHQEQPVDTRGDRTGVWNGPAPRGYNAPTHAQDLSKTEVNKTVKEPEHILLPKGVKMPLIGLGTYLLSSADAVKSALAAGYRHFDCATAYENESIIGQGLSEFLSSSPDARSQLWITSKVGNYSHRPEAVVASVNQTIKDLGCEYLDLLLIHWPIAFVPGSDESIDTGVTIADTWAAMEGLVDAGLVRYLGVSNFSLTEIEDVLSYCRIKPVCNQIELHPLLPQRKLVGVSLRKGVHSVAFSPLGHSTNELIDHPVVVEVAKECGKTPSQVLLKWNVQRGVAVIPKAQDSTHQLENIEGLFTWRLTWDQKAKLDTLETGRRFCTFPWKEWEDPEEGGAAKPSKVMNY